MSEPLAAGEGWIETPHLAPDYRGPTNLPLTPFPDPADSPPIIDILTGAARASRGQTAFEDDSAQLSFDEFRDAVHRLARAIAGRPGTGPVGILLPAGVAYPVAVFACLAAGRLSLLLDSNYPPERNRQIADAASASLIIAGHAGRWNDIELIPIGPAFDTSLPADAGADAGPGMDAPAFILTTSGSAGRPKLIAHSQRTMLHWVRTLVRAMHVGTADRVLSVSSPSSLGGFTSLLTFPLVGAASQMFEIKSEGLGGLIETLRARPVTILRAAPSLLRALAQHPGQAQRAFEKLRLLQTYGEPLLKADVAALGPLLPTGCRIRTTYGSTEASGLSWYAGEPDDYDPVRVATGVLMPDTRAIILGEDGRPRGPGEEGELVISSRYNGLGEYSGGVVIPGSLPPNPDDGAERSFRTGDSAVCAEDGVFVVLGRKDRMVKINGQRLEPAEVEAALRAFPEVARAEVAVDDEGDRTRLIAFVVPGGGAGEDLAAGLLRGLERRIPGFMIPSRIMVLDSIPLLPGGKVDSLALLALARANAR